MSSQNRTCPVCQQANATKRCSRCNAVWYCSPECQRKHWTIHKPVCNSEFQSHQYELHKKAFDAIIEKYNLKTEEKSTEIAEVLTSGVDTVTPQSFAERFGMDIEESVVFLEWVKIGIKFKEQAVDIANKSGFNAVGKLGNI